MRDLTLLRSDHLWAIAHDNHILLFWDSRRIHPVGQPLPPDAKWQRIAAGPAVLEFIKELGIFDQMVEMYAEEATKRYNPKRHLETVRAMAGWVPPSAYPWGPDGGGS